MFFFSTSRFRLCTETLRKLVLIHDNLPRVCDEIKTWNLKLHDSEAYLTYKASTALPAEEEEEEGSDDDPEPLPEDTPSPSQADMFEESETAPLI